MTTKRTAIVCFGEPIHAGYVLIWRDRVVHATSVEHERWKRAHPEFCRKMASGSFAAPTAHLADLAANPALAAEVELDRIPKLAGEITRVEGWLCSPQVRG